jgi:hypothetical protein
MPQIIFNASNARQIKLLLEIGTLLNIKGRKITSNLAEDIFLTSAIDEGRKTKKVSRKTILKKLKAKA